MSALLLPLLPVGILIAPVVIPAVLGAKWEPMVAVFQMLLVVGVGYAILNCIGETLSGTGHIAFRAKAMVARGVATLLALVILVHVGGIQGGALAQLIVLAAYTLLFVTAGARRACTSPLELWRSLRPVAAALGIQLTVTGIALVVLVAGGSNASIAPCAAAVVGLMAAIPLLLRILIRTRS
jgi:O-antigen/teichoic acid export membrane protein